MGWAGKKNGELLKLLIKDNFSAFITFDKNLQYQQNFNKYPIPILVLIAKDNTFLSLVKLIPKIHDALKGKLSPGPILISEL